MGTECQVIWGQGRRCRSREGSGSWRTRPKAGRQLTTGSRLVHLSGHGCRAEGGRRVSRGRAAPGAKWTGKQTELSSEQEVRGRGTLPWHRVRGPRPVTLLHAGSGASPRSCLASRPAGNQRTAPAHSRPVHRAGDASTESSNKMATFLLISKQ